MLLAYIWVLCGFCLVLLLVAGCLMIVLCLRLVGGLMFVWVDSVWLWVLFVVD